MTEKRKSRTSTEAKTRYNSKTYDVISIRVPKDMAADFKAKCTAESIPQAQIIKKTIEKFINRKEEMTMKNKKEIEIAVEKVIEEAKKQYEEEHGKEKWDKLTPDEKFDIADKVLQKYYIPGKGYEVK